MLVHVPLLEFPSKEYFYHTTETGSSESQLKTAALSFDMTYIASSSSLSMTTSFDGSVMTSSSFELYM